MLVSFLPRNSALFLENGKDVTIPGKDLFSSYRIDTVGDLGEFECYPNRNSTQYLDIYPLRGECQTIIRGTYRNRGWCDAVKSLADLDYLNPDPRDLKGKTYADLTRALLGKDVASGEPLKEAVAAKLNLAVDSHQIKVWEWLGLFSDTPIPSLKTPSALDALCDNMLNRMQYAPGERDMLIMKHTVTVEYPAEKKRQVITSRLTDFGIKVLLLPLHSLLCAPINSTSLLFVCV